jgi:hypothetical protein
LLTLRIVLASGGTDTAAAAAPASAVTDSLNPPASYGSCWAQMAIAAVAKAMIGSRRVILGMRIRRGSFDGDMVQPVILT